MSELSKQKEIGENMSDSRQLTTLVKELDNTLRTVKSVDEYLSRIAKAKEVLGKESVELSETGSYKYLQKQFIGVQVVTALIAASVMLAGPDKIFFPFKYF